MEEIVLSPLELECFEQKGFAIISNFFSRQEVIDVQSHLIALQEALQLKRAGIGKGSDLKVVNEQRGDYIFWLDTAENHQALKPYFRKMERIRLELNRSFYFGLSDIEAHLALYPKGAFYKKHSDRHQHGSKRVVSAVLYLNTTWESCDGGELVLDLENGTSEKVIPEAGKLIIFLSHLMHEVNVTQRDRMSITGWFLQR